MPRMTHHITAFLLLWLTFQANAAGIHVMEQELSDSVITAIITAKYTKDRTLNPLKISVSTENGIVRLSGHVKNKQAFVDALKIAQSTKGVKEVDTEGLDIKPVNTAFTDAYITAKVETAVLKAKVIDDESIPLVGINAKTINGIVTLTGKLKNKHAIEAVLNRVAAIRGVKKIISNLKVSQDA